MEDLVKKYKQELRPKFDPEYFDSVVRIADKLKFHQKLFDEYKVRGLENLADDWKGQKFYVSNHVSMSDFLIEAYILWKRALPYPRFIAGANLNWGPFKNFWKNCGAISIDRNIPRTNRDYWKVYKECILETLLSGESLLSYPEGGRNNKGEIRKFKTGTFEPVIEAVRQGKKISLVPLHISYDKNPDYFLLERAWSFKSKRDKAIKEKKQVKAKLFNSLYVLSDIYSYIYRFLREKERGSCYLIFGEPFSIRGFLKRGGNKRTLAGKTRDEILKLSGVAKLYKEKNE